ncbi:MAG TPA: polysaccharide deacetylase family protein [Solirubrobacteraceae bacterium]|nr:polysaccharide deacetylase family protein [Solirubrobacteraceae bacterium]
MDPYLSDRRSARSAGLRRRRMLAAGALLALVIAVALALALPGGARRTAVSRSARAGAAPAAGAGSASASAGRSRSASGQSASAHRAGGHSAPEAAPILMYHVINPPPAGAPFPGLYVPAAEFAEQMHALKAAGFVAVTLEELAANWREGAPLPPGRPVVISFDNGYQSQYDNALPVLEALHWQAIENIQLSGLPPSQGGMSEAEVRGLIAAGWELDTQGYSHAELPILSPEELHFQIAVARQTLRRRYHVPVRWFCYPSGHYTAAVIAAVRQAGFVGATTVIPGWASAASEPYRLPRIRVLGGTNGAQLVALIEGSRKEPAPPPSYT